MLGAARDALPELPAARRERYRSELGLDDKPATQLAFDADLGSYFERALEAAEGVDPPTIANWVTGELAARLREADEPVDPARSRVTPTALAELAGLVAAKRVSTGAARQVLAVLVAEGGDPGSVVEREGLGQIEDSTELAELVARAIAADPEAAAEVGAGNMKAIGPLVGFVMKETKGRADGGEVTRLIREQLAGQG
jgi:aspartyl-tRNA(Asn)/glutamyl-tRNA(Gln) amidotransferase subunit B